MSRLLARLLQTIDEAPDPVSQARARLQRALYCARRGDLDGAQASADPVRQNPRLARLPALAVDLILVDAAILLFSAEPAKALDKARRAAAIAQALSDGSGVAASAAWVAWCALWLRRYDEALAHAAIA
ncbi:MAG: hypothetical protein Q8L92_06240, partial [Rubrivivax sp.]|nr:hypothetical protein [Rubrivivax sp.]